MAIVHDLLPMEDHLSPEFRKAMDNVSTSSVVKLFRYKILNPQSVVLVEVCSNGYRSANAICLKALVGIPVTLDVSRCPATCSKQDLPVSSQGLSKDCCPTEMEIEDPWNEVDESKMCAGSLDTMLTSPDFVEDFEREKVFAPGEDNHPISVFKDQYCEELAYPGIFCDQARADNKDRHVPVYYSDICKSELRRSDRRVAQCVENIFFKLKKLQMKIILGKCQVALRKHKTNGKRLTAGEVV